MQRTAPSHPFAQVLLWLGFRAWALIFAYAVFIGLLTGSIAALGFWILLAAIGSLAFLNRLASLRLAGGNEGWATWSPVIALIDILGVALLALLLRH